MRRMMKWTVELHGPSPIDEHYCVEAHAQFGNAQPMRILHFGVEPPLEDCDIEFICSRLDETLSGLIIRNIGAQQRLMS